MPQVTWSLKKIGVGGKNELSRHKLYSQNFWQAKHASLYSDLLQNHSYLGIPAEAKLMSASVVPSGETILIKVDQFKTSRAENILITADQLKIVGQRIFWSRLISSKSVGQRIFLITADQLKTSQAENVLIKADQFKTSRAGNILIKADQFKTV